MAKSFVEIPDMVLEKKLGLRAVYMYAKMRMLENKGVYNRESWVTHPFSGVIEMSVDAMSEITKLLVRVELIRIGKKQMRGSQHPTNMYLSVNQEGGYKPVNNDFINHSELSAEAKGLGILMALLKEIPKSNSGIGKAIGVSGPTVKKYLAELIEAGIYDIEKRQLNEAYFPFREQVRKKKMQPRMENYEEWLNVPDKMKSERMRRQLEWLKRLDVSEESKALIFDMSICTGIMGRHMEEEPKTEFVIRI